MKKVLILIAALLLAAAVLSGCVSLKMSPRNSNTPAKVTSTPEPTPTPTPEPTGLARGVIEGRVYTNESAQLTFTAPEGWVYADDEEIALIAESDEVVDGMNTYDMVVAHESGTSVAIMFQDLASTPFGALLDEETYLDSIKEVMDTGAFGDLEFSGYSDAEIGPNTYKTMVATYKDFGIDQYYYTRREGDCMLSIIVSLDPDTDIDSVMANFS